jgi:hypothetical protein
MKLIEVNDLNELRAVLVAGYQKFDSVLDVGAGIRPFSLVPSARITCVEPYAEYRKYLNLNFGGENLQTINAYLDTLTAVVDVDSFDVITLMDVVEHIEKEKVIATLQGIIAAGANRVIIFTPEDFMPQHTVEVDAWGLSGAEMQDHVSGWNIGDFENLGFQKFIRVKNLHYEGNEVWNGLMAIYERARIIDNEKLLVAPDFDNPATLRPKDTMQVNTLYVFGRHNRSSGTVSGAMNIHCERRIYLPSLTFLPKSIRWLYLQSLKLFLG